MKLKLTNWQRIIFYNYRLNHLPLSRYAMKLQITPGYFNILVKELISKKLLILTCPDLRSKRIVLSSSGEEVAASLYIIHKILG